jgi:FKBP-type peptidyl-prolyl cis-trans isomerase SlyD
VSEGLVEKNSAVSIEYTLRSDAGEVIDTSVGDDPLTYLHGHGQIVPGLEREITGKKKGDEVKVKVSPADGYGEKDERKTMKVPKKELPKGMKPEVGMQLSAESPTGDVVPVWVTEVHADSVTLDGNHPLAGQNLNFEIKVMDVRPATKDELEHGHVHGPGGHH